MSENQIPEERGAEAVEVLKRTLDHVVALSTALEATNARVHKLVCQSMAFEMALWAMLDVHPDHVRFRETFDVLYEAMDKTTQPDDAPDIDAMAQRIRARVMN